MCFQVTIRYLLCQIIKYLYIIEFLFSLSTAKNSQCSSVYWWFLRLWEIYHWVWLWRRPSLFTNHQDISFCNPGNQIRTPFLNSLTTLLYTWFMYFFVYLTVCLIEMITPLIIFQYIFHWSCAFGCVTHEMLIIFWLQ